MTFRSCESRATDATKSFTGKSSLAGSIVQTWAATTRILLREKLKVDNFFFIRLNFKMHDRILVVEVSCKKFQIYMKRLPHTENSKLKEFKNLGKLRMLGSEL